MEYLEMLPFSHFWFYKMAQTSQKRNAIPFAIEKLYTPIGKEFRLP